MGLLEVSVGVSYATSRWTLTTTLFRAIKRINLSRGSKTCFYTSNEDWLFLRILRRWIYNTGILCYIFSLFVLLLFLSSFFWRSNSCKNSRDKEYSLENNLIFLLLVGFFITLWLGDFFWCIFSSKFLLVSLF